MSNYYYVDINSDNLTIEAASEILKYAGKNHLVRDFAYHHGEYKDGKIGGELHMYIRGLPSIVSILEKYGITENEIKWEDEFDRAWAEIFEQYFIDLPITKEYHSTLEKNINEEVVQLNWNGENQSKLEEYFKTCWGSRNFRFEPENGIIIGTKER